MDRIHIINVTAHPIDFVRPNGSRFWIEPSGVVIHAAPVHKRVGTHPSGATLVNQQFTTLSHSLQELARLERENPDAIIVGSTIAAMAYAGSVFGMVNDPRRGRRNQRDKLMRADHFSVFPPSEAL